MGRIRLVKEGEENQKQENYLFQIPGGGLLWPRRKYKIPLDFFEIEIRTLLLKLILNFKTLEGNGTIITIGGYYCSANGIVLFVLPKKHHELDYRYPYQYAWPEA